jgi:hypothetical protein
LDWLDCLEEWENNEMGKSISPRFTANSLRLILKKLRIVGCHQSRSVMAGCAVSQVIDIEEAILPG